MIFQGLTSSKSPAGTDLIAAHLYSTHGMCDLSADANIMTGNFTAMQFIMVYGKRLGSRRKVLL